MRPGFVKRNELDSAQNPDCWEYELVPDVEQIVSLKESFVLKLPEIRLGEWRLRPDSGILYIEKLIGSSWVEQGRFEI